MFPTKEQLYAMPITALRNQNVRDGEQEKLVQEVLNERIKNDPRLQNLNPIKLPRVPDIRNGVEEAHWQKIINDAKVVQGTVQGTLQDPETFQGLVSLVHIPKDTKEPVITTSEAKPRHECCGSKGFRHKKDCPTLNGNIKA